MNKKALLIVCISIVLILFGTNGFSRNTGYRKIGFPVDSEGILGDSQVWKILCRDTDGKVFLATNDGLFVFDGARMRRHYVPQVNTLRDLVWDPGRKRLYCAVNNGFGWWEDNAVGGMDYRPLEIGEYSARLQDFWRVCIDRGGHVFFQAMGRLCIYDPDSGKMLTVTPADRFRYMHQVGGNIYVQDGDVLCHISEEGKLSAVCSTSDRIMNMASCNGRLIAALERTGLAVLEGDELWQLDQESNRILSQAKVISMASDENRILAGTTSGGLYVTDGSGRIVDDMKQGMETDNATVLSVALDRDGDIWMGLEAGVARIDYKSNEYYLEDSRLGRVRGVVSLGDGSLLIGSNKGAFLSRDNSITPIPGTTGSVWSISLADGIPYIAHDQGMFMLDGHSRAIRLFSGTGVMSIVQCTTHPDEFICGTYNGLALFRKEDGRMEFQSYISNYSGFCRHILMDSRDRLWIRDSQKGFIRLTLDDSHTRVLERKDFVLVRSQNDLVYPIVLEDNLFFCCNRQTWSIDPETEDLVPSPEGDRLLGMFIKRYGVPEDRNASGPFHLDDGSFAIGLLGGIRFCLGREDISESLYVSQVEVLGVRKRRMLDIGEARKDVPYDMNTAVIYLGGNVGSNEVEYRSVPGQGEWHNARFNQPLQLSALPFGDHDIQFRLPDSPETACTVRLHIRRPWYLAGWAIGAYILLIVGFFFGIREYYLRQTRKEEERIRLKTDLKAKNKELANITFNNAKRNRQLNEIKAMLTDRKTVALIDGYLSDESDWEKSEEYFNVIYDGLLEKLKSTYPGISKTDMKICVYTKLNLSTKEIADIMNISIRSVEMARYRLRKRLGLPPGQDIAQMLKEI